MNLVYKNEKPLFFISVVIGALVWIGLIVGTVGIILVYGLLFFVAYLFAQSGFISHLRGNTVELSEKQYPEMYSQYLDSCKALEMSEPPRAYLMMSDGVLNALATRFLRNHYVVVYSSVVDALRSRPEALRFYFGHELAHIKQGHLNLRWLKMPASILPLIGASYRRAQEYTCDLHGLAASRSRDDALAALAVLGTGGDKLPQLNTLNFMEQLHYTDGFWMSYHEFTNDYPWLCKRLGHIASAGEPNTVADNSFNAPSRNKAAAVLAAITPRLGVAGGSASVLVLMAFIGILAAIAIPAYQDYVLRTQEESDLRAQVAAVLPTIDLIEMAATPYVKEWQKYPDALSDIGLSEELNVGSVKWVEIADEGIEVTIRSDNGIIDSETIVVAANVAENGSILWNCFGGTLEGKYRPPRCRAPN